MSGIHSTHRIFAFIQARTGSTRLSGKILRDIPPGSGITLIDHIALRLGKILPADRIIFLIPDGDSGLLEFCKSRHYLSFTGPEEDVRERYILAAKAHNAEIILRLTGDNPFIDLLHTELLIEAFVNSPIDIASFYGLPIGMGIEIFSTKSLIAEPESGLEPRHREHVSLHLKEETERFQFLKLKPILDDSEINCSEKIRMTIDEIADFQLLEKVFSELCNENQFFGARDVIALYKEKAPLFSLNENVNQVLFPVKRSSVKTKKKIFILYANPEKTGSGHFERCKILFVKLQTRGYEVSMSDSLDILMDYDLFIIDHRDIAIPEAIREKNILLIDNFGSDRKLVPHHDVLPNPEVDFNETLGNLLFPSIIDFYNSIETEKIILIYSGNMDKELIRGLDESLVKNFGDQFRIVRIGNAPSEQKIELHSRVSRKEYFELLAKAEFFISYFGQSIMEAIYLQKRIALFSISDYHEKLGDFLSQGTGILHIGNVRKKNIPELLDLNEIEKPKIRIRNEGYNILLEKIGRLCP